MNGVTVHMQAAENDRIAAIEKEGKWKAIGRVRFYSEAPGLLNTVVNHYSTVGKDPKEGAVVVVRLMTNNTGTHEGGTRYKFEEGDMRLVLW